MQATKRISLDTVVNQSPGFVAGDMDGNKVMLDIEKGKYYALDSTGSRVWELIETPRSVMDVVTELIKEYDVDPETCQHDVLLFLNDLYSKGLVAVE